MGTQKTNNHGRRVDRPSPMGGTPVKFPFTTNGSGIVRPIPTTTRHTTRGRTPRKTTKSN